MIKSFADKDTEKVWNREFTKSIPAVLVRRARMKLIMIDAATSIDVLRIPPSNHLEALRGDRKGQHSIRINDAWRVCFKWKATDAFDVEIVQYHAN